MVFSLRHSIPGSTNFTRKITYASFKYIIDLKLIKNNYLIIIFLIVIGSY